MNSTTLKIFIKEPTECPCCGYLLEKINDQLFCRNVACPEQLNKKIEHFVKILGIKGLGPKTIEKLNLQNLSEVFYMTPKEVAEAVGEKTSIKLLDEIEKAKSASIATVLESFSIPLVGNTASKKLSKVISNIEDITMEVCKQAGLGDKVSENILNWKNTEYKEIKEFLPFTFSDTTKISNINNKTVCITGKLKSFKKKSDAAELLANKGFTLVDSVTKSLDFLVDESDKMSSKKEKAMQYGISIITDLNDLLKE